MTTSINGSSPREARATEAPAPPSKTTTDSAPKTGTTTDAPVEAQKTSSPSLQTALDTRKAATQNATATNTQAVLQAKLDKTIEAKAAQAPQPAPPATKDTLISKLLTTQGTATAEDAKLVRAELQKLPQSVLQKLVDSGAKVVTVRGSVVEARPNLKGVTPRGWPPGSTWDSVPGLYDPAKNEVIIATRDVGGKRVVPAAGNGHGSANLVIHETMHAYDEATGASNSAEFKAARNKDLAQLSAYEKQAGAAGLEESFAESAALYYTGGGSRPNLNTYFQSHVGAR